MNVVEAIESIVTSMELMQEHGKQQDEKIKELEKRSYRFEAIGVFIGLVALLAVIFFS